MSLIVCIVPDKFKGTLTAQAAADAIARGWQDARPKDRLTLLPMSDGGDGFGEVISALLRAKRQTVKTVDAAHRPCNANWWWQAKTRTAVIESATVIGLAMLPPGKHHPHELDTFGLGLIFHAAVKKGAKKIIIGIGGSATNDGGFGLARALGWQFLDGNDLEITRWTDLHTLASICPQGIRTPKASSLAGIEIIVAVDVQNPLLGAKGATRVYGPQKGIRPRDVQPAERCLRRLAHVVSRTLSSMAAKPFGVPALAGPSRPAKDGTGLQTIPGAGAAGGLGFGLMAFAGAKPQKGFDLFARLSKLVRHLRTANLVITGEGMIDRSSLMGKGAGEIARHCRKQNIPCIGLAGSSDHSRGLKQLFAQVQALTDLTTVESAKARPALWLERLTRQVSREFVTSQPKLARASRRG